MKLLNFEIGVVSSCQKLAIILEKKSNLKIDVIKKCVPKFVFFNEKKNQKYSDDY
jgi:hypothetical protein